MGNDADGPTDTSGSMSALAAIKGTSGVDATQFTMNGMAGYQADAAYAEDPGSTRPTPSPSADAGHPAGWSPCSAGSPDATARPWPDSAAPLRKIRW